jgi:putative ABC transport system permease protein
MTGLLRIGLKILANDRGKFMTLIVGITIAVFLMMQVSAIFSSVLHRMGSNIVNIGATLWVMDPSVNIEKNQIPIPKYTVDLVRSIKGVKYAVPVIVSDSYIKLANGHYQNVELIGLDDVSLFGRPKMLRGDIKSLYQADSYIGIQNSEFHRLNNPVIGTTFEINNHRGVITGIATNPVVGLWGLPTLYTTYSRAAGMLPKSSGLSYVLVEPKSEADIPSIKMSVTALGYLALTKQEYIERNTQFYLLNTGFGINLWIMDGICFVIGLSIAGQVFYMFILDNVSLFGALKAIGAKKSELITIILFQSIVVGIIGYGMGVLLSSIFTAFAKVDFANYTALVTYQSLLISFFMVLVIITFTSLLGVRKVTQIEPYDIFRS